MRVLFLTQTYPRFEGDTAGPFIQELARGLVRRGDEVTVLAPHAEGVDSEWREGGVEVRTFRYAPEKFEALGYSRSLDRDEKAKIGALAVAPLYWLAGRRALLAMVRGRSYDLVHAHWIVPNALLATAAARRLPFAIGLHGSDVFMAEKPLLRGLVARSLRRCQLLTGCSGELVDRVCKLGRRPRVTRVIPYGVDTDYFAPDSERRGDWRERLGIPAKAPVVLSVGRMATKKGYQVLLPILDHLLEVQPEVHVVLAGEGDRLAEFKSAAAALGERVHFPGIVYRQDLAELYRAADIFVLPAVHDPAGNVDGLPNVILEAMASGLPVIASGISGIPLAVEHRVTGLLVPEGDGEALFAALHRLLAAPDEARSLGSAGRRKVEEELTWDAIAGRYRDAYLEVVEDTAT